ncbi:hypothetical protein [Streptomyces jumonjinensis]|uniref:hypothetical protein n=1 Tax=Streptomyces jumonjinensis TaxID=1945 RepID=UPI0037BB24F2
MRKTLTAAAVAALVVAGSTACGTVENLSAGQKLDRAFDKLGKERSLSVELDLDADAAAIRALDAGAEPGDEMPDAIAELLTAGRISVMVESEKPLAKSGEKDYTGIAVKLSGPDSALFEYRMVGDYLYGRVDMKALGELSGGPAPSLDDLASGGEVPKSLKSLEPVFAGEWVKVPVKEIRDAEKLVAERADAAGAPPAEPTLDAKTQQKLLKTLGDVVASEADFKSAEGKDGAERITVTASLRPLLTKLIDEVRPILKKLPQGAELPTAKELRELPEKEGSADFTIRNGAVTEISIDLAQLDEKLKGEKLPLVLRLGAGDKPTAPVKAAELEFDEMLEGFMNGFMEGSMNAAPASGFSFEEAPGGAGA